MTFVHLQVHTEYSIVDGLCTLKALMKQTKADQMPALAITDLCNLFGLVKFYQAALSMGIKPIIGSDIYWYHPEKPTERYRAIFLCQNMQGYRGLTELISKAYLEGKRDKTPLISSHWFTKEALDGLIVIGVGKDSDVGRALLAQEVEKAENAAVFWKQLLPQRFYLQVIRTQRMHEEAYVQAVIPFADARQIPLIACNEVCFLNPDDFEAHEARVCIHEGQTLDDPHRPKQYSKEQYLRSSQDMQTLFDDLPDAIINTVELAKRCNVTLTLGKSFLPQFDIPGGQSAASYLRELSRAGLEKRLDILFKEPALRAQKSSIYHERLETEINVIINMGFSGYFLIVADFIQWAKQHDIPVGPGRGSGAGSLAAYALNITDLDPLAYELLFERFLNPERVSMPDFDIDFCMDKRDQVIEYVAHRYGRMSVSQIITFGTMAAKAVVRDVGRVLGYPYGFVDKIAKLIPFELGITLDKALNDEPLLKGRYEQEEEVKILIDLALKLEGITRNAGKHAGGVVISPSKLTDFTPIYCEEGSTVLVSQFDKDDVETVGLVKFDFLGLRTLTIIDWACKTIRALKRQPGDETLDITLIPLDDPKTFELLKACQTTAVFQLESRGMKDLIKRLQPDCFEEIIALVALFRPGPLQSGMVDDFIHRKHGRAKVEYPHPEVEPILSPTYGVILYQEQVMQIAQVLAGYTLGNADLLRRAMGKKKPEEMAKQREFFTDGSVARGVSAETAAYIFDLMEKFAGYGFNKSHSAAYALVSYQTAWLKAHYPAAFMAAVLSSDMDNTDKVVLFMEEAGHMNLKVLPPDVNRSGYPFTVNEQQDIVYGLGAIKGVGLAAVELIVQERKAHGPFKDLFDFCKRLDLRKVNRRVLEALIKAGAFDTLNDHRAAFMAQLESALQQAEQLARNAAKGQVDLFGEQADDTVQFRNDLVQWNMRDRLQFEKETLGFYLSGHPITEFESELNKICSTRLKQLKPTEKRELITIAGFVIGMRIVKTKKDKKIAIVTLDDKTARVDISFFGEIYEQAQPWLQKDILLVVKGEASIDEYTGGMRVRAKFAYRFDNYREMYARQVHLLLQSEQLDTEKLTLLCNIVQQAPSGSCEVLFEYHTPRAMTRLPLPAKNHIVLTTAVLSDLQNLLGHDHVKVNF